ncbi:hypothetical protein PACTADRAFT_35216 [Pachysolen tannophilus NRRL Y-2460]|uniref:HIT domain-containing protein n=1 Tax=Pachysolen tannophilus NRRL Y-2460 TaxID=669874 RepID=A0A1E4TRQ3_PACTA|nr:hypothetical protein PACTADRAFT_35216 [Pachysolen tannophilus NRRL Y-2460]
MPVEFKELVRSFNYKRILKSDPQLKILVILGTINDKNAIISLEKTHFQFTEDELSLTLIKDLILDISQIEENDIYYWGVDLLKQDLTRFPSSKINLIYPATDVHIKKYDQQEFHMITETPQMYTEIVEPYINKMKGDRIKWVKNILFDNKEAEKIIYRDDDLEKGFVILPDMKWDAKTLDSLYLVCIVMRQDISSLRDLNESHIPWLQSLLQKLRSEIPKHYVGIKPDNLRIFIHYQPSYYHFHIHIVNVKHPGLGDGISVGKAILLEEIIENLKYLGKNGYKNRNITYAIGENHDLWEMGLKDAN